MNILRRSAFTLMCLLGLLAPVGCSGQRTANVSVFNSSTSELRVNAWVAGQIDPNDADARWSQSARLVAAGGDTTFAMARPKGTDEPGIVLRIAPVGIDEDQPFWIQLQPPGPYFLRVRGTGSDLTMTRENINVDESGRGPGGIPPAAGERRYRGTLPPWVAR